MAEVAKNEAGKQKETSATAVRPEDGYKIVAIAADVTGKSMVDEIFQIAAYTISEDNPKTYEQYIMPYRDVGVGGQKAHGVRVYNNYGLYRILCDIRTGRILRTKSEYSTLNSFMKWLGALKGNSKGIILVHHGNTTDNMMPFMLQALDRYKLADAFYEVVHGSVNCKTIAAELPQMKDRSLSFVSLLRRVLGFTDDKLKPNLLQSAKQRAELTYKIAMKILNLSDSTDISSGPLPSCATKEQEREILLAQRVKFEKVRTLRPIFIRRVRASTTFKERNHIAQLRRHLIDLGVDYDTLKTAYTNAAKDGIEKLFENTDKAAPKKKQEIDELISLLISHFENTEGTKDINANVVGEKGKGEPAKGGSHASGDDDDDDEEFEEAQNDEK